MLSAKTMNDVKDEIDAAARYLTASQCGDRYRISTSHWRRLVDSGRAPTPTRFGRLLRWHLLTLDEWDEGGNKPLRVARRKS